MNYAVAGGHHLTAKVAEEIILAGGNAIDASIAAYATAFTTEPAMASPGAGAFALVSIKGEEPLAFDFFCHTPRRKRPLDEISIFPIDVDFGGDTETFYGGLGTIAVPGSVDGIFTLHERYGKMPLTEIMEQAVNIAKEGVEMNWFQAYDLELLKPVFTWSETGRSITTTNSKLKGEGQRIAFPELADFLYVLAREGKDLFYKGEVANRLISDCLEYGGHLTFEDLSNYQTLITKPLHFNWDDHTMYSFPQPSMGGTIVADLIHSFARKRVRGDWRSGEHLKELYEALISADKLRALTDDNYDPDAKDLRGSTSHLNVLDVDGNAVSLTTTIGEGSGYFIPGTMIHMNNMLGEPSLLPGGLNSWIPQRQLPSMMCPVICLNHQGHYPELIMGTGGASRIPFMLAQVWQNVFHFRMPVDEAVERPRIYYADHCLQVEDGTSVSLQLAANDKINLWDGNSLYFGGVHAITWDGKGQMHAHGDTRREGFAIVG